MAAFMVVMMAFGACLRLGVVGEGSMDGLETSSILLQHFELENLASLADETAPS